MMMWAALINYLLRFLFVAFSIWMVFDIYRPRFYYGMDQKEHLFGFGFVKLIKWNSMNGKYIFPQRVVSMSHRMETAQAIKKVT